jgi:hypothetical protein
MDPADSIPADIDALRAELAIEHVARLRPERSVRRRWSRI